MGGDYFKRLATDAAQRFLLVLIAATLAGIVFILLCGALVVGLSSYLPLWSALLITAAILLIVALVAMSFATSKRGQIKTDTDNDPPTPDQSQLSAIAVLAQDAMKSQPKTTLALTFAAGLAMGLNKDLRRDILDLLKTTSQSVTDKEP